MAQTSIILKEFSNEIRLSIQILAEQVFVQAVIQLGNLTKLIGSVFTLYKFLETQRADIHYIRIKQKKKKKRATPDIEAMAWHSHLGYVIFPLDINNLTEYQPQTMLF